MPGQGPICHVSTSHAGNPSIKTCRLRKIRERAKLRSGVRTREALVPCAIPPVAGGRGPRTAYLSGGTWSFAMGGKEDRGARLLQQRRDERSTPYRLAKTGHDFYPATRAYLDELRVLLQKEIQEDPLSQKVDYTRNQYQRALTAAREVQGLRLSKIAHLAVQAAAGGAAAEDLLPEEKGLYEAMVRELKGFTRQYDFDSDGTKGPVPEAPVPAEAVREVVVRIVADGPQLPIETYGDSPLHKEDVVTLPEREARILIDSKRAVLVDSSRCS